MTEKGKVRAHTTPLPGVLVIEPRLYGDARGYFYESYHAERYRELGIGPFVQDNHSRSVRGVLRGLHFQRTHAQAKLVGVARGEVFDVAVDVRPGSAHFGKWFGITLSGDKPCQLYVPAGFAHGFCVLSESADFVYKCSDFYHPEDEGGVIWNDPQIGIDWPVDVPTLSEKDSKYSTLAVLAPHELPSVAP